MWKKNTLERKMCFTFNNANNYDNDLNKNDNEMNLSIVPCTWCVENPNLALKLNVFDWN